MLDPRGHFLETFCEIDLDAFAHNIAAIRNWACERDVILAVKANAYGHGVVPICREALRCGVRKFGVATLVEAVQIRDAGIGGDIIILTPPTVEQLPSVIFHRLTPNVTSLGYAQCLSQIATDCGKRVSVHIEIDTGMGRTGIDWFDAVGEIIAMAKLPNIDIGGIFSHFPAADSADNSDIDYTKMQLEKFSRVVNTLQRGGIDIPCVHISNSAGIMAHPLYGNCVRPGIAAYGIYPDTTIEHSIKLTPIATLKTHVVQIRKFEPGQSIGYGRTFTVTTPTRVAIIRAGYGDGLRRALSNRGEVVIRGKKCPIVGRVCMDTTMVEVGNEVVEGDIVTIIGKDGITAEDHARWTYTIPYEILTGISERVRRIYLRDGEVCEVA